MERVEGGSEIVVTRRGRPVARLTGLGERPLETLARRRVVRSPRGERTPRSARVESAGSDSDLVAKQAGLIFYFDTSALVKLVIVEDGSAG